LHPAKHRLEVITGGFANVHRLFTAPVATRA